MSLASAKSRDTQDPRYSKSGAVHVPAGEGPTTWFAGDTYTIKASRESTNGSLGLVDATVPPGGGPVAHIHTRTDEAFYILSGQLEILDGARSFIASPGDFVFIPRGTRHRFKNTGVHGARMLFMFTPGGDEGVFRYGDEPQPGHPPPVWTAERFKTPEILRFNEEFGIEIVPEADPSEVQATPRQLEQWRKATLVAASTTGHAARRVLITGTQAGGSASRRAAWHASATPSKRPGLRSTPPSTPVRSSTPVSRRSGNAGRQPRSSALFLTAARTGGYSRKRDGLLWPREVP